ncbi:MAG: VOC family protein [Deltaproteobacteria bacterium]|nr:VOC family protein [Deltaproteobacteria bacterium]MBW2394174.1 VOC family protein [Deltaproteobacteria bacterium]
MTRPALVPELSVSDLSKSMAFYVDLLGFRIEYDRPEEKFAALSLGSAHLMLEQAASNKRATAEEFQAGQWRTADLERPFGRGLNLEIEVEDLAPMVSRLSAHAYSLLLEPHEKSRRVGKKNRVVRELLVADPDGYLIRLSQPIDRGGI